MKPFVLLLLGAPGAFAALPSVGPDYRRPTADTPAAYRDANFSSWKTGAPADGLDRGPWWTLFGDLSLDDLETRALAGNQDLRAAAARVEEAAASAGAAGSAFWPQASLGAAASRGRSSQTTANPFPNAVGNDFSLPLSASWELDLFGRIRRLNESARADAEASAALFASVRLALTADLAADYYSLHGLDREGTILRDAVALRQRELDLVTAQRRGGAATELDTSRAETELASAQAEADAVAVHRAAVQDALAVLVGAPASSFSLPPWQADYAAPEVPAGLPSELLERRPDIAAAERQLAAANARIGVARAAFFPTISLTGAGGFESADTGSLLQADSRVWSIGPTLYLPIFQGGRNRANLARSRAAYDESVAAYRQQVLAAFREVQDALTATRLLAEQAEAQERALRSARHSATLAETRYQAGFVSYLEVIDAQRTELAAERASVQLAALRLNTSVALIKALGGGWRRADAVATLP